MEKCFMDYDAGCLILQFENLQSWEIKQSLMESTFEKIFTAKISIYLHTLTISGYFQRNDS